MFLKSVAFLAVLAVLFKQSSATCSNEYPSSISGGHCTMSCGAQKCLCSDDISNSSQSYTGCLQRCDRKPEKTVNVTVTNCPDMTCNNLDTCFQVCSSDNCRMECKAKTRCNQECGGGCTKAVCSAAECHQQCHDCTMECTSKTKKCYHLCLGGICYSKCAAETCDAECDGSKNCKILSSAVKQTPLGYLYLIFGLVYFLAQA